MIAYPGLEVENTSVCVALDFTEFLSPVTRDIAYSSFYRNGYCFLLNQTKELLSLLMMFNRKASAFHSGVFVISVSAQ